MRLIDADKLNFLEQHYNKSQMKAILDFLDAQPTAYDVDKVVKELEEWSFDADIMVSTIPTSYSTIIHKNVIAKGNAIEIVKENINHE